MNLFTKIPSFAGKRAERAYIADFSGGAHLGAGEATISDTQSPDMKNMWFENGKLRRRPGISQVCSGISGALHSHTERDYHGRAILHIGAKIYAFDGETATELLSGVPDLDTICFEMNDCVYFMVGEDIVTVKNDLTASLGKPYVPTYLRRATSSLSSYEEYEAPNAFSRQIRIEYRDVYDTFYDLPFEADIEGEISFENEDGVPDVGNVYYSTETRIIIDYNPTRHSSSFFAITYTLAPKYLEPIGKIAGCTVAATYGGTKNEGTRLFLSGNPDFPGYYFRSELLRPTYFTELSFDIVGNGNDDVTGFAKQYGDLYIFTRRTVSRLIYDFDAETGASFILREINSNIGCDMPKSIALIDNRVVFANSYSGVCIIDSTDTFNEQNIKPISANINSRLSQNGLLSHPKSELENAKSIDSGGRYWLCVGDTSYVWDYSGTSYYDGGSYSESAGRLSWYLFDGFCADSLFELDNRLFIIMKDNGETDIAEFSRDAEKDLTEPIGAYFMTKSYDLGYPNERKRLSYIEFTSEGDDEASFSAEIYADGEKIYARELSGAAFEDSTGVIKRVRIKVPPIFADLFSVKFITDDARSTFGNLAFEFHHRKQP